MMLSNNLEKPLWLERPGGNGYADKYFQKNKKQFKRHNEKIDNAAFYEFGKSINERLVIEIDAPPDQDPLEVKKLKKILNLSSIFL